MLPFEFLFNELNVHPYVKPEKMSKVKLASSLSFKYLPLVEQLKEEELLELCDQIICFRSNDPQNLWIRQFIAISWLNACRNQLTPKSLAHLRKWGSCHFRSNYLSKKFGKTVLAPFLQNHPEQVTFLVDAFDDQLSTYQKTLITALIETLSQRMFIRESFITLKKLVYSNQKESVNLVAQLIDQLNLICPNSVRNFKRIHNLDHGQIFKSPHHNHRKSYGCDV